MTREEFESILEEAFLKGYNNAYEEIFDESLDLDSKRELADFINMLKKKGMSKEGVSLNTRMNVASRAAKEGYIDKEGKNPYVNKKTVDKYTNKFIEHLRKNPNDAKKYVQAKTRVEGGSYKNNLLKMNKALYGDE